MQASGLQSDHSGTSLERLYGDWPEKLHKLEHEAQTMSFELPTSEAVFVADRHGKVLAASRRYQQLFFPQGNGLQLSHPRTFAPLGDQELLRATDELVLSGLSERVEFRHTVESPQVGVLTLCTVKMPLVDGNGQVTGVVGISRPVSESAPTVPGLTDEQVREKVLRISTMPDKELTVLRMVCRGHSNKEIANQIHAPLRTIENRRRRIMSNLGVQTLADLVKLIVRLQDAQLIKLDV